MSTLREELYRFIADSIKVCPWQAKISAYNKRMHLGYFDTAEEAHEAYCVASSEYHGEFRRVA